MLPHLVLLLLCAFTYRQQQSPLTLPGAAPVTLTRACRQWLLLFRPGRAPSILIFLTIFSRARCFLPTLQRLRMPRDQVLHPVLAVDLGVRVAALGWLRTRVAAFKATDVHLWTEWDDGRRDHGHTVVGLFFFIIGARSDSVGPQAPLGAGGLRQRSQTAWWAACEEIVLQRAASLLLAGLLL